MKTKLPGSPTIGSGDDRNLLRWLPLEVWYCGHSQSFVSSERPRLVMLHQPLSFRILDVKTEPLRAQLRPGRRVYSRKSILPSAST